MISNKQKLFFSICLLSFYSSFSQKTKILSNTTIAFQTHYGSFITATPKASYLKDSYSHFNELFFVKMINNQQNNNLKQPTYWGGSVFFGNTGSKQFIGSMGGVYPFLDFGIFQIGKFKSRLRTGVGIGIIEKPYDVEKNHKNILLSTAANLFINANWQNMMYVSKDVAFNIGLSFSHLSNATTRLPNLGINIPALSAGFNYTFNSVTIPEIKSSDTVDNKIKIRTQITTGFKQGRFIKSKKYNTLSFSVDAYKNISAGARLSAGVVLFNDPSLKDHYLDTIVTVGNKNYSSTNSGIVAGVEKVIGKFSIPLQVGMYVQGKPFGELYQNIGLNYRLNPHFSVGAYLKTHFGKADFMHGGINYTF